MARTPSTVKRKTSSTAKTAKKTVAAKAKTKIKAKTAAKGKVVKATRTTKAAKPTKTARTVKAKKAPKKVLTAATILRDLTAALKGLKKEEKSLIKESAACEKALKKVTAAQAKTGAKKVNLTKPQKALEKANDTLTQTTHALKKVEALIATIEQFENKWSKIKPTKIKAAATKPAKTKAPKAKTPTAKTNKHGINIIKDEITELDLDGDFLSSINPTEAEENPAFDAEERENPWLHDGAKD